MGGFKNESLNIEFERGMFRLIILHLSQCSCAMKRDYKLNGRKIFNDEDKITNQLIADYLNINNIGLRFIPQSLETFDLDNSTYRGICDIKIVSASWFQDLNDYYLVECKRIDGGARLNREYVLEGVSRFVLAPPKYPSYHKRNIMFGYVVKAINIPDNITKIEKLQNKLLTTVQTGEFIFVESENNEFYHYSCVYQSAVINLIELAHIFYDFSDIINDRINS